MSNVRRKEYMDYLMWVDEPQEVFASPSQGTLPGRKYPACFSWYLSRLLLARDSSCGRWWSNCNNVSDESPELLFSRFEASVAATLERDWRNRTGVLASRLMKRFSGRFPLDGTKHIRLCFSTLPEEMMRDSYFDQEFEKDRDEAREVFDVMDSDGDGKLSSEDLRATFKALDSWPSKAEIREMLEEATPNKDRNGEVDFDGFQQAIAASQKQSKAETTLAAPVDEWWRDPAALLPADLLEDATPEVLRDAYERSLDQLRSKSSKGQLPLVAPLSRERTLDPRVYVLFMAAGALSCMVTHVALVPIDVVKTLQQTEPWRFAGHGLVHSIMELWRDSGVSELFLGLGATLAGYAWYGAMVFPGYEFFKRLLVALCGPRIASRIRVPLVLLSGAMATFFACIGVCPAEAVRIRTVKAHGFSVSFLTPVAKLYAGFVPLLFRQVLFGMAKFFVFDTFASLVYRRLPGLARHRSSALLVSLLSGATAGLVATFVSQPADAILTRLATTDASGIASAAASLWSEGRIGAFYAGFSTRSVWAAAIIGGQFLFYDIAKSVFKVTANDLSQTADAINTSLSTKEPAIGPNEREAARRKIKIAQESKPPNGAEALPQEEIPPPPAPPPSSSDKSPPSARPPSPALEAR